MGKPNKGHKLYWKHVVTFHSTRSQLHTDRGVWLLRTQNLLGSQPTFSRLGKERKESSSTTTNNHHHHYLLLPPASF